MIRILLSIVFFTAAIIVIKFFGRKKKKLLGDFQGDPQQEVQNPYAGWGKLGGVLCLLSSLLLTFSTSFVWIGPDETGHLTKIYGFKSLQPGQIIAYNGEKGKQAEILMPGFQIKPLLNVIYKVETKKDLKVPAGQCAKFTAIDGTPLEAGEIYAPLWKPEEFKEMLQAETFLKKSGKKGPQATVIPPGDWKINQYLFEVDRTYENVTSIKEGFVGVVKSNIQEVPFVQEEVDKLVKVVKTQEGDEGLVARVVPKGYIGIWNEVLYPGKYYLNRDVFEVTEIDTRVLTWTYKGGYTRRFIDLQIGEEGKIVQKEWSEKVPVTEDAAAPAINARIEGWLVPVELRALVQVVAEDAPYIVASVGDVGSIEDKIFTPAVRSVIRNVTGNDEVDEHGEPKRKVLDLIGKRKILEDLMEKDLLPEGKKGFVTVKEIRLAEPAIPPELMVARLREQLATQLANTFKQEKLAQDERIKTEKAREEANQQAKLIEADIEKQAAEFRKESLKLEGEGEKLRLEQIAEGQKAQAAVLGEEKVLLLAMIKEILAVAEKNPEIVKVPLVSVIGSGDGSIDSAAALLGSTSNISQILNLKKSLEPTEEK